MDRDVYLDKVIKYLVEDTIIDYKNNYVIFPFYSMDLTNVSLKLYRTILNTSPVCTRNFFNYCRYNYGLTENEIEYVWNKYKDIILHKL